ncbi:MAG: AMP-binding protein [Flavobacteriaceae bacterium]|nr:AMP-binding protein [Flavobacteriaceae bacterium]
MKKGHLHIAFKLNGESFKNESDLLKFIKNKHPDIALFLTQWFDGSEFITVQTSGSTGSPKPIKLKKEFMINSAKATGIYFNLPQNTSALLCLPINFIAGKMMLIRSLVLGWHLDIVESSTNPLKGNNKQYDFAAMVPIQLFNSLIFMGHIKKLIVGGGLVSKEIVLKLQKLSTGIYATYGMTETITHIAVKPLNFAASDACENDVFQTLPSVRLGRDARGCLLIDAPNLSDERIITNDLVTLISNTEFKWLGRYDNIINSGGVKLIPEQIEEKLSEIISNRFFVIGIPDTVLGDKLILICEGDQQIDLLNKIIGFQKENATDLAKLEVPKKVYFVNKFIVTESNKIKRTEILKTIKF